MKFVFLEDYGVHTIIRLQQIIISKKINFVFGLLYFFWLVDNMMTNWMFFGEIIDECSLTLIVYRYWLVFILTWWPTKSKWRIVLLIEIKKWSLWNYLTASKNCDRKYQEITESKILGGNERWYFNMKHFKNKNIILVQYTMVHYVHFYKQSCK